MKSVSTFIILCLFSFTVLAQPYTRVNSSVDTILKKYDYLLTSHPQAHESEFKAKTLKDFTIELKASLENSSKEDVLKNFESILNKIPQQEKREAYLKMIKNSSKDELAAFLSNPQLLSDSLRGEGSNFAMITGEPVVDVILYVVGAVILYAIIESIVLAIKYEDFKSYQTYLGFVGICDQATLNAQTNSTEREAMKNDAAAKCDANARRPITCEFSGWSYSFSQGSTFDQVDEYTRGDCYVKATYRAKKRY